MKKLVSLLLALTIIVSCGAALAAEDGKITIWTWDPNFNIAAMKVAKEMYNAEHPDVEIVIEEVLSEDIETRVITAASAGDISNLPDIMLIQDNSAQKFILNYPSVYADITGKYDFDGFAEGSWRTLSWTARTTACRSTRAPSSPLTAPITSRRRATPSLT